MTFGESQTMRMLLLDPASCLDTITIRRLAADAGLALLAIDQPEDVRTCRETENPGGFFLWGGISGPEQAKELDALLDDRDCPLDLVIEAATDPRPQEQRLADPQGGDSPLAAYYRQRGLLKRVWGGVPAQTVAAAIDYSLRDARRARHPEQEAPFPPEVAARLKPQSPVPEREDSADDAVSTPPVPPTPKPVSDDEGRPAPSWRRSAARMGRIKRGGAGSGGKGWKPRS
jgi:hypothetical protein